MYRNHHLDLHNYIYFRIPSPDPPEATPPHSIALHPNEAEVRPGLPGACERLCEVSVLQGGEGGVPLGERGPVDHIDIMGEADGKRLVIGVLGPVALLGEVL